MEGARRLLADPGRRAAIELRLPARREQGWRDSRQLLRRAHGHNDARLRLGRSEDPAGRVDNRQEERPCLRSRHRQPDFPRVPVPDSHRQGQHETMDAGAPATTGDWQLNVQIDSRRWWMGRYQKKGLEMRLFYRLTMAVILVGLPGQTAWADGPKDKAAEEAALVKNAEAFIEAFHKGDAKALAAFWVVDGDYTLQTGKQVKGRSEIEKVFAV